MKSSNLTIAGKPGTGETLRRALPKKESLLKNIQKNKMLYLFLVPGVIYFIIFKYGPMYGLLIAFKDYNFRDGILGSPWVGFEHFTAMFKADSFYTVFRNTFLISFYKLIFAFPGPIILAIMLNEIRNLYFKRTLQTVVYLPHFLSWVIAAGIFLQILGPVGVVNEVLSSLNMRTYNWFMEERFFRGIVVVSHIWKEVGWGTIIYLGAISGINPELYEAAYVDGAKSWHMMWRITLPTLIPTIVILFILQLGRLLEVGFEQIFVLYNPMVYEVGDVFATYIYRIGLQGMRFSYTAAIGVFESVAGLILVLLSNWMARRVSGGEYGIW